MSIANAKSLLFFAHGSNFAQTLSSMKQLVEKLESGKERDDNGISLDEGFEWDSSPIRHTSLASFLAEGEAPTS